MGSTKVSIIREALANGLTPYQIRTKYPLIQSEQIANVRKKYTNLPAFRRGRIYKLETRQRVRDMKVSGMSYRQIGAVLGISGTRAQQYLRVNPHIKASHCSICGKAASGKDLHYHHTDYKSNTAIPVCGSCHSTITQTERRKK